MLQFKLLNFSYLSIEVVVIDEYLNEKSYRY